MGLGSHGHGCRLACSDDDTCDAFEYTKSTKVCKKFTGTVKGDGKASSWKQVRFIPKKEAGWTRGMDNLTGSERFGDQESTSTAWAIRFDNLDYTKIKV